MPKKDSIKRRTQRPLADGFKSVARRLGPNEDKAAWETNLYRIAQANTGRAKRPDEREVVVDGPFPTARPTTKTTAESPKERQARLDETLKFLVPSGPPKRARKAAKKPAKK